MDTRLHALNTKKVAGKPLWEYLVKEDISYLVPQQIHLAARLDRHYLNHDTAGAAPVAALAQKIAMAAATLWGVVRMVFSPRRILVYGVDVMTKTGPYDPRMALIYQWLEKSPVSYGQLVHTTPHPDAYRNWRRRQSPVIYIDSFELLGAGLIRFGLMRRTFAIPEGTASNVREVIARANVIAAGVMILRNVFRFLRFKQVWLIDDNRFWHQIVSAAHRAGTRTVLFQHGRFNAYQSHFGYPGIPPHLVPLPDTYVVWSAFWKKRLLAISPPFAAHPDRVRVGGKASAGQNAQKIARQANGLHILFVHEPGTVQSQIREYVSGALRIPDALVSYKIRADRPADEQVSALGDEIRNAKNFSITATIPGDASVALGSYSTLLYEIIELGISVGILRMDTTQADDLVQEGLAAYIDNNQPDLEGQIRTACQVSDQELARRAAELKVSVNIEDTLASLIHA